MTKRHEEFRAFEAEVSKRHGRQFQCARDLVAAQLVRPDLCDDVFPECPCNDSLRQCLWTYQLYSRGNAKGLTEALARQIEAFVFLSSDFEHETYDMGNAVYAVTPDGQWVLEFHDTGGLFAFDGTQLPSGPARKLQRFEFLERFGSDTEAHWPRLAWIRARV